MGQHLEICFTLSVNQCLPDDKHLMLQNHTWVKEPFKVQDKPTAYCNRVCKFCKIHRDGFRIHFVNNL